MRPATKKYRSKPGATLFRILAFVAIAYLLAWLVALPMWALLGFNPTAETPMLDPTLVSAVMSISAICMMFTPAIAAIVCEMIWPTNRDSHSFTDRVRSLPRSLAIWPLTPFKVVLGWCLLMYLGFYLFYLLHPFVAAALGVLHLDLVNFSGLGSMIPADPGMPLGMLALIQVLTIPIGALFNVIPVLGEELGWRGYLLPRLHEAMGLWPALIVHGAIWGLWHTPLTLLGHNFGLFDFRGVGLMILACTIMGVVIGYARIKTGSVWPSVFAHAMVNGAASMSVLLASAEHPLNLVLAGGMGLVAWAMLLVVIAAGIVITKIVASRQPRPSIQ